jgi:choline dehydrogenase-like flavoprotein
MGTPDHTVRELLKRGFRGSNLDRAIADRSSRELELATMTEQLPDPENRIVPDYEHRDALGLPRPRIRFRLDDYTRRGLEEGRRIHLQILTAMKCTEVQHGDDVKGSGHVIGTYRMGSDPKRSVVDADLRAHDHPNLYLLGSGVFPTGGASNPTLTIAAMALRAESPIRRAIAV